MFLKRRKFEVFHSYLLDQKGHRILQKDYSLFTQLKNDEIPDEKKSEVLIILKKILEKREKKLGTDCHCPFCEGMYWIIIHNKNI